MADHKVAIVTGASSGIGRETAIQLAQEGYHLALVSRSRQKLQETADLATSVAAAGVEWELMPTDLCDPQATRNLARNTLERFGRIDAVANVAGYATLLAIEQVTEAIWRSVIDTNLSCVVHLTAAIWPILRQQNGGVIVNVSSMASVDPFPGLAVYAAAKAGLNIFTRATAQEGQDVGIRAVAISPGAVETPMLRELFDEAAIPPSKTLAPEDVAAVIRDCITGQRDFEPGQNILLPSP